MGRYDWNFSAQLGLAGTAAFLGGLILYHAITNNYHPMYRNTNAPPIIVTNGLEVLTNKLYVSSNIVDQRKE